MSNTHFLIRNPIYQSVITLLAFDTGQFLNCKSISDLKKKLRPNILPTASFRTYLLTYKTRQLLHATVKVMFKRTTTKPQQNLLPQKDVRYTPNLTS